MMVIVVFVPTGCTIGVSLLETVWLTCLISTLPIIIPIFQKKNSKGNIQEEVSIEQLIHFLQIELPKDNNIKLNGYVTPQKQIYMDCFGKIEDIHKIVENIKYLNIENHKKNTNKIIRCESDSSSSDDGISIY